MTDHQPGILAPVPPLSRYLEFSRLPGREVKPVLGALSALPLDDSLVVGLGPGLVAGLGSSVAGLRPFPAISGPGCNVPSTQADIWIWLRGDDRGDITRRSAEISGALGPAFERVRLVDGFKYGSGRDLTGYEDGTENPEGDDAVDAAIVTGSDGGPDGSSFVAVQQWAHDLCHFGSLAPSAQDDIIGRRLSDNEEFDGSPPSAHVKRTAQESFDPEAFVVRRSMPWSNACGDGLMFVAFGATLNSFEVQMRRMVGEEDGIVDGLFQISRPVSGSYFWCPPVRDGRLNMSAVGL